MAVLERIQTFFIEMTGNGEVIYIDKKVKVKKTDLKSAEKLAEGVRAEEDSGLIGGLVKSLSDHNQWAQLKETVKKATVNEQAAIEKSNEVARGKKKGDNELTK